MILVPISEKDKEYLFDLQNINGIRNYALNTKYPTAEEHNIWFSSKLNSLDTEIYKINAEDSTIGIIRVDKQIKNIRECVEISLTIDPSYSGKGYAKEAISKVVNQTNFCIYNAVIHKDNIASIKAFLANSFKKVGIYQGDFETYEFIKE